ncbi:PRAME family member 8-like [Bos indicus]|uniref:PRAME family member 8-like n=1 Tax=Bos indicus TaxID=9915 RepID=A0A6P5BIU8_BOSIN
MSVHNPPRLAILAAIGLLRDEPLAISTLEFLPTELYPLLFMAAVFGRRRETLKAMVPAWPFARLPLGSLMQKPHQGTLQAVLEGLDVLLAQKVHPRRGKLRVLDLRNTGQDFWNMWSGGKGHMPSSSQLVPVAEDMSRKRHPLTPLEVYIELCLTKKPLEKFLTYLFRWVEQRKASIHLCCKKMKIISMSKENMKTVLRMVKLDCVQMVKLSFTQKLSTLAQFAPLLGQMSNVQSLILSRIRGSAVEEQDHQDLLQLTSQILRLQNLRDLRMEAPFFLEGRLDQMLRCLKTPLDNISITNCLLTESDLTHLSWCPKICQLKGLNLSGVTLTDFNPKLLQVLLEKVAGTLEELDLNLCGITDIHLNGFLPALSCCSQLRVLTMCGNLISMAVLERVLHHTDRLPDLNLELYPAPRESYSSLGVLHRERFAQIKAKLREVQTAGARFMEYWPEFLERVVWSQHSRGLTLRNGTSGGAELKDTAGLGSLKVYTDLCLSKRTLDNFLSYLPSITKVLNMVQLDCIQEVQVTWIWHLSILATFAPLLGQTSNVQKPRLSRIHSLPMPEDPLGPPSSN